MSETRTRQPRKTCKNCGRSQYAPRMYGDGNFCTQKCAAQWADKAIAAAPKLASLRRKKNLASIPWTTH